MVPAVSAASTVEHVYHLDKSNTPKSSIRTLSIPLTLQNSSTSEAQFDDDIYMANYIPPKVAMMPQQSKVERLGRKLLKKPSSLKEKSESSSDLLSGYIGDIEEDNETNQLQIPQEAPTLPRKEKLFPNP